MLHTTVQIYQWKCSKFTTIAIHTIKNQLKTIRFPYSFPVSKKKMIDSHFNEFPLRYTTRGGTPAPQNDTPPRKHFWKVPSGTKSPHYTRTNRSADKQDRKTHISNMATAEDSGRPANKSGALNLNFWLDTQRQQSEPGLTHYGFIASRSFSAAVCYTTCSSMTDRIWSGHDCVASMNRRVLWIYFLVLLRWRYERGKGISICFSKYMVKLDLNR